jgi:hypothetical protein
VCKTGKVGRADVKKSPRHSKVLMVDESDDPFPSQASYSAVISLFHNRVQADSSMWSLQTGVYFVRGNLESHSLFKI